MSGPRILVVVDDRTDFGLLRQSMLRAWPTPQSPNVTLFSLSSNFLQVEAFRTQLITGGFQELAVIDSARRVADEISTIREQLGPWFSRLSTLAIEGKALKDYFMISDLSLSAWWLGLASERSPLKTPAFLQVAQVTAISKLLSGQRFDECLVAIGSHRQFEAIAAACSRAGVRAKKHSPRRLSSFRDRAKSWLHNLGWGGHAFVAAICWIRVCYKVLMARRILGPVRRTPTIGKELLFVTYFPAFDRTAAKEGRFSNTYAAALQTVLKDLGRPIHWILVYTNLNQTSYREALEQAKRFAVNGEAMQMLEQFCSLRLCVRVLYLYCRLAKRALSAYRQVTTAALADGPMPPETEPLWRDLWHSSFIGSSLVESLFFSVSFERLASYYASGTPDCLYYWEMQAWEKALCSAWAKASGHHTIAFQHASLPRNLWSCFPDPGETIRTGAPSDLPLPDLLIAGGKIPSSLLGPSMFPKVTAAESVRYVYLNDAGLGDADGKDAELTLLVAGSIDRTEAIALTNLIVSLSPHDGLRILMKGHPSMSFGPLLQEFQIDRFSNKIQIWDGDLQSALSQASVVLVSASTVAMEALAFGCKVIAAVVVDAVPLNPVMDLPESQMVTSVSSPRELDVAIDACLRDGIRRNRPEGIRLVNSYWDLNPALSSWSRILSAD